MVGLKRNIRTMSKYFMRDNLILTAGAGLGFCSSLAVTNKLENALTMGIGVTLVTAGSFCMVYPFKKLISTAGTHHKTSLLMIIVSVFVAIFGFFAQAFVPAITANIKAYIDLITTNCIVLAVISEGLTVDFWEAQKKILKACLGYSIALILLSFLREPLGFGTIMGFHALPDAFPRAVLMVTPVGGFFALAAFRLLLRPFLLKSGIVHAEASACECAASECAAPPPVCKPAPVVLAKQGFSRTSYIAMGLGVCLLFSLFIHLQTIPTLHKFYIVLFPVLLNALFFDGIVLSKLLGMCPLINKSRQIDAAWKMGVAVIIVTTLSTALNWIVYHGVLVRSSDFLSKYSPISIRLENIFYLTVFIVTIAVFVQILSVLLRKFARNVYEQMGQFLELITVNCIVLASATFTIPTGATFMVTTVTALGYGLHWMMVIVWLALLRRQRLFVPTTAWDEDTVAILLLGIMAAIFTGIGMIRLF
ncbi:MAG TPA: Rnf-Nqr domain containing protein [Candidatus Brocadiaceae bacterium]